MIEHVVIQKRELWLKSKLPNYSRVTKVNFAILAGRLIMPSANPILAIENQYGQSIWMDNLSRDLIESGELKQSSARRGFGESLPTPQFLKKQSLGIKSTIKPLKLGSRLVNRFPRFMKIWYLLIFAMLVISLCPCMNQLMV